MMVLRKYPVLPQDLASDILQFAEFEFAQQYFSTHRTGFIFKRKVPVAQIMTWQKVGCRTSQDIMCAHCGLADPDPLTTTQSHS